METVISRMMKEGFYKELEDSFLVLRVMLFVEQEVSRAVAEREQQIARRVDELCTMKLKSFAYLPLQGREHWDGIVELKREIIASVTEPEA